MKPLPHQYEVIVTAGEQGHVEMTSPGLNSLVSAPPKEFGGPGDLWSPETLTVAAAADCFVLTFRAVANASKLRWSKMHCHAKGVLDRAEGLTRFTEIHLYVTLELPDESDPDKARRMLERAEKACLVGNSLRFQPTLHVDIVTEHIPHLLITS